MILRFFISFIPDLALYWAFAAALLWYYPQESLRTTFSFFLLFLYVLLPLGAFFFYYRQKNISYAQYHNRLLFTIKLWPGIILILLPSLINQPEASFIFINRQIIPLAVLNLFFSVLALRLLRHQPGPGQQSSASLLRGLRAKEAGTSSHSKAYAPDYAKIIGISELALVFLLLAAFVYFTPFAATATLAGKFYQTFLAPVVLILLRIFALPIYGLGLLWAFLAKNKTTEDNPLLSTGSGEKFGPAFGTGENTAQLPMFSNQTIFIVFIIIFLFCAWLVLRKLTHNSQVKAALSQSTFHREKAPHQSGPLIKNRLKVFAPKDNNLAVRYYYGKFLSLCQKQGIPLDNHLTSRVISTKAAAILTSQKVLEAEKAPKAKETEDSTLLDSSVSNATADVENINRLRELYLIARYCPDSSCVISDPQREEAKNLYRAIKEAFADLAKA